MNWGRYERLRPHEIEAIKEHTPIAYVPWGAIEWHSYHNPIGLDGMQSLQQCIALAQKTGGIVLPPFYVGTDTIKPFKGFSHTLEHSPTIVKNLCKEVLTQLADEGFELAVVITGHMGGGHLKALQLAEKLYQSFGLEMETWITNSFEVIKDTYPLNHAARGETSFQLLYDDTLVDLGLIRKDTSPTLDEDGVWGENPMLASIEEGKQMLDKFVEKALVEIRQKLEQKRKETNP